MKRQNKMKRVVIFKSSTGFTKRYADWIAKEMGCEAVSIENLNKIKINDYDTIIYGGWIMGSTITGLNKIRKTNPKELVIFASGITPASIEYEKVLKEQNNIEQNKFYYFEGGLELTKLNWLKRKMLGMVRKSLSKKEDKTEQDVYMEKMLGESFDNTDKKSVQSLIEGINENKN